MEHTTYVRCQKLLWTALLLLGALTLGLNESGGGVQGRLAQGAGEPAAPPATSPLPPTTPPELVKPAVPLSKIDSPEAIFRKLDVGQRGYVSLEDTKDLIGFKDAFMAVDTRNSGQLTLAQFKKAWSIYKSKK